METNELKEIWIELDGVLTKSSQAELKDVLITKTRKSLNKFRLFYLADITICFSVIIFLLLTAFQRQGDVLYLINNGTLFIFMLYAMIFCLFYIKNLQKTIPGIDNLYELLESQVQLLSKSQNIKYDFILIPFISTLLMLSINVNFSSGTYIQAFQKEENLWGLVFGFITGTIVGFYSYFKLNNFYKEELTILKNYQNELNLL
jgi:hypothetical protein